MNYNRIIIGKKRLELGDLSNYFEVHDDLDLFLSGANWIAVNSEFGIGKCICNSIKGTLHEKLKEHLDNLLSKIKDILKTKKFLLEEESLIFYIHTGEIPDCGDERLIKARAFIDEKMGHGVAFYSGAANPNECESMLEIYDITQNLKKSSEIV